MPPGRPFMHASVRRVGLSVRKDLHSTSTPCWLAVCAETKTDSNAMLNLLIMLQHICVLDVRKLPLCEGTCSLGGKVYGILVMKNNISQRYDISDI